MPRSKKPTSIIETDLIDEARNAVYWVGQGWTLARILETGTEEEVARLEKTNNQSQPFPPRGEDLLRKPSGTKNSREGPRKTLSFAMQPDLLERARNAAAALGIHFTEIVLDGAERVMSRLRAEHNEGNPFPPRPC